MMLKNSPEKFGNPEESVNDIITGSLKTQLQKMEERAGGERDDEKYLVLRDFIQALEANSFEEAYEQLNDVHKHIIITRLQNEVEHLEGNIPYDFIQKLEEALYGTVDDEDGNSRIDFSKKIHLERQIHNQ